MNHRYRLLNLFILLTINTSTFATSIILEDRWIKFGINDAGTLGYSGSISPGLLYDPSGKGNFIDNHDFITPGTPFQGFSISTNEAGIQANNNSSSSSNAILKLSGSYPFLSYKTNETTATWLGQYQDYYTVKNSYTLSEEITSAIIVHTEITALKDLTGLKFATYIDPDQDSNRYSTSDTLNERGSDNVSKEDVVSAKGNTSGLTVGIMTISDIEHNTAISTAGWSVDPDFYLNPYLDGNYDDSVIGLAFNIENLLAGNSILLSYLYIFDDPFKYLNYFNPLPHTPDIGSYLAIETMGNTLFTSSLEDREGASQYQNLGHTKDIGNVWIRAYGGHNQFKSAEGQLKTKGNSLVTQIGTSLVTLGEEDQYNLGVMGGFATYDGKTRSNLTNLESKTKIDGYSLGLYGTWYAHPVEKRGAYIDSWVLWNKFNNSIETPNQNKYEYDSSGITASIEIGGDYLINKNGKKNWWIQPQSQVIYQGVHADNVKDAQGVNIYHGKDNVQARMGVKTYLNIPTNGNNLTSYRPYVALNFIHNTNPYSIVIDDVSYENEGAANLGEFKVGIEGNMTKNSQVWLNASYVAGNHSNQAYQGNIGWKYNF